MTTSTLILLNLPPKTFIGFDLISFNSSPQFHGVKNIPPGFHFLYTGADASLSIRHGHWIHLTSHTNTSAWKWDADDESLKNIAAGRHHVKSEDAGIIDEKTLRSASQKARSDGAKEGANPAWPDLTTHISSQLLSRLIPDLNLSSISSAVADTESIPGLSQQEAASFLAPPDHETTLSILPIDLSRTFPPHATGRERTQAARDRSWYLGHLIDTLSPDRQVGASQLIGELQFCFLMTMLLANYSCLQGWKRILEVVFTCERAVKEVPGFFAEVLRVLREQVRMWEEVEGGLFETEMSDGSIGGGGKWLRRLLRRFRVVSETDTGEGAVRKELVLLEQVLKERYGWDDIGEAVLRRGIVELEDGERVEVSLEGADEEDEQGEWAPVVVDLDGVNR